MNIYAAVEPDVFINKGEQWTSNPLQDWLKPVNCSTNVGISFIKFLLGDFDFDNNIIQGRRTWYLRVIMHVLYSQRVWKVSYIPNGEIDHTLDNENVHVG